ncbi:MAG: homoserine O-succinyltransferase [Gammaproteobacteria bacterium]|jgi:homoserine O-succinyltransferase
MPLVANTDLPSFARLRSEGETILDGEDAVRQDIREMHIGLLNMMPGKALEATERQFFRLVGESNQIAQFYVHPFTLNELQRDSEAQSHVDRYYKSFEQIKEEGLDALIISGATPGPDLSKLPFWDPLIEVFDWAIDNVTSILCSCLATHAVLQFRYKQQRFALARKRWGVYSHRVSDRSHPLVAGVNTRFDVPHSRFNQVDKAQFEAAGLKVLVETEDGDVHLAVSEDGFRIVFFQGHPEYDTISLLKEYKREIGRFISREIETYPPFPEHYFSLRSKAILEEYQARVLDAQSITAEAPEFPETLLVSALDNTWHDSGEAVINNWIGKVYQLTHVDRRIPFREGVDPAKPLGKP